MSQQSDPVVKSTAPLSPQNISNFTTIIETHLPSTMSDHISTSEAPLFNAIRNPYQPLSVPATSFPDFNKLPLELQQKIFRAMFPSGRRVGLQTGGLDGVLVLRSVEQPVTARINRASREETKLRYHNWNLQQNCHVNFARKPLSNTILVNFKLDTVCIPGRLATRMTAVDVNIRQALPPVASFMSVQMDIHDKRDYQLHIALAHPGAWGPADQGLKALLLRLPQMNRLRIRYTQNIAHEVVFKDKNIQFLIQIWDFAKLKEVDHEHLKILFAWMKEAYPEFKVPVVEMGAAQD